MAEAFCLWAQAGVSGRKRALLVAQVAIGAG